MIGELPVRKDDKKKRAAEGSLMEKGKEVMCGFKKGISGMQECDHIGRNYRQPGSFVKGFVAGNQDCQTRLQQVLWMQL
jgi:hypothetical protein